MLYLNSTIYMPFFIIHSRSIKRYTTKSKNFMNKEETMRDTYFFWRTAKRM